MARVGLNPDKITAKAMELADEHGFDHLTIASVAKAFGVKDASIYGHLRNLEDLKVRVAERSAQEFADQLSEKIEGRVKKEALTGLATVYRNYAVQHPGRYLATQLQAMPVDGSRSAGHLRMGRSAAACIATYGLQDEALTDAVRFVRSTLHGFSSLELQGLFQHSQNLDASFKRTIDALDIALTNWPQ